MQSTVLSIYQAFSESPKDKRGLPRVGPGQNFKVRDVHKPTSPALIHEDRPNLRNGLGPQWGGMEAGTGQGWS